VIFCAPLLCSLACIQMKMSSESCSQIYSIYGLPILQWTSFKVIKKTRKITVFIFHSSVFATGGEICDTTIKNNRRYVSCQYISVSRCSQVGDLFSETVKFVRILIITRKRTNTTFRKLDLFPSSGEGRHLFCWVP
jgi:hypothetical protein